MQRSKIISAIIFSAIVVAAILILNHLLVPWTTVERSYMAFDEQDDDIDFLIVGDSLEEAGFDIDLMSNLLEKKVARFTQASSYPECHYYMLLDALKKQHHLKTILLGYAIMQNYQIPFYDDKMQLRLEFLKRSRGNSEIFLYAIKNTINQRYLDLLLPFSNYRENFSKIASVLSSKKEKKEYLKEKKNGKRLGDVQAKVANENEDGDENIDMMGLDPNAHKEPRQIGRAVRKRYSPTMSASDKKYLGKIKALCDKNKIELIVVASSVPTRMQEEIPMMKSCMADTKSTMKELGITYIDTSEESLFPNSCDTYNYRDWVGHYNLWYRPIHTKQICEYLLTTRR